MTERPRAADDFDTIRQRMTALRFQNEGKCAIREGARTVDCWCYKAGPDGNTLPCPPPPNIDALSESPIGYQIISITNLASPRPGGDITATFSQALGSGLIDLRDHPLYGSTYARAVKIEREIYKEYME